MNPSHPAPPSPGTVLVLGGDGWPQQPVAAEDLGELVARALDSQVRGTFEVVGPQRMPLRDYLLAWRRRLRLPGARVRRVPMPIAGAGVMLGEAFGGGPIGATTRRMLRRCRPRTSGRCAGGSGWAGRRS